MNWIIFGQTIDSTSFCIGVLVGIIIVLILIGLKAIGRRRRKAKQRNIKVIKEELEELHLLLGAANTKLQDLYSFFDDLEVKKRQRNEQNQY